MTADSEESSEAPSTSADVQTAEFNPGSLSPIVEKGARAFRAGSFGVAAYEFSQAINQATNIPLEYR